MNNNPEIKLKNENFPLKTELEMDLESILSHESIFEFVNLHYMRDLGNDTPASSAEMEEAFRSFIYSLGFKGAKVEAFIQRAMTSIDDYDFTDKFDNIKQMKNTDYGDEIYSIDFDKNIQNFQNTEKTTVSNSELFRNKHKNNPFYIDPNPNKKPKEQ